MLKKYLLILFIINSFYIFSHPHVYIDLELNLLDSTNVEVSWTFDLIESENKLYFFDDNSDGILNSTEINNLYNEGFYNLKDYNYFIKIKNKNDQINIEQVYDFNVIQQEDNRLTFKFRINIPNLNSNETLSLVHFDTSYFISFSEPDNNSVHVNEPYYFSIYKNKNTPFYYDPNGARGEVLDTSKPKPGWLTAYPTEVIISTKPIMEYNDYKISLKDKISQLQRFIYNSLSEELVKTKSNSSVLLILPVLLFGFLYGVIHAVGPGHRKIILSSYILSNKNITSIKAVFLSMISALIHSGMGILLIITVNLIFNKVNPNLITDSTLILEKTTLYGVLTLSLVLIILKVVDIFKKDKSKENSKISIMVIIISSLVPCPGAITIMLFSITLSSILIGVLTVLSMSVGIGITLSIVSLITLRGKKIISTPSSIHFKTISNTLEWLGLGILFIFSAFMILMI